MYEDIQPLFSCAMLPALAIALAKDVFQDYHSYEEIFAIPPPIAGTVHCLRIKEEMLEVPFFQTFDANGPTGMIEKAGPFSTRTVNVGHRAVSLQISLPLWEKGSACQSRWYVPVDS